MEVRRQLGHGPFGVLYTLDRAPPRPPALPCHDRSRAVKKRSTLGTIFLSWKGTTVAPLIILPSGFIIAELGDAYVNGEGSNHGRLIPNDSKRRPKGYNDRKESSACD